MDNGRLIVGDLLFDRGKRQVSRDGQALALPKLSYRLFEVLADAAPNVVSTDELIEKVWSGRIVSPETITQRIKLLRQSLGDDAQHPQYIGLVRGEGYRLLPAVDVLADESDSVTTNLFNELGRRRVFQVALLYAAVAFSITEIVTFLIEALPVFPEWSKALVAIVFVVGFPVAMFLAWRFDYNKDGLQRTGGLVGTDKATIALAVALMVGATAGLFYLIYPSVVEDSKERFADGYRVREALPNAIVVLPFVNASGNTDDQYISEGMGDVLRDQLGNVPGLQVAAPTSSSWRSVARWATSRACRFWKQPGSSGWTSAAPEPSFIHLTLVPFIHAAGEQKTKPTQHSVRELRAIGIQPDVLLCRTEHPLSRDLKSKIALFCNVDENAVITALDVDSIYELPLSLAKENIDDIILNMLELPVHTKEMSDWEKLIDNIHNPKGRVQIGVVGKYVSLREAYKSLNEALAHGGTAHEVRVDLKWIEAEDLESGDLSALDGVDGVLVPGGFGPRGTEGMAAAAGWARKNRVPYLGICYGFQWAVVEFARSVCGMPQASSTECHPDSPQKVILMLRELVGVEEMGGTMRLGAYPCDLTPGSLAERVYGAQQVSERHRHRYEFNQEFEETLSKAGLKFTGRTPDGKFVEIAEIPDHPWFLAVQFHPEFKSRPLSPHPLFSGFIEAAKGYRQQRAEEGNNELPRTAAREMV